MGNSDIHLRAKYFDWKYVSWCPNKKLAGKIARIIQSLEIIFLNATVNGHFHHDNVSKCTFYRKLYFFIKYYRKSGKRSKHI